MRLRDAAMTGLRWLRKELNAHHLLSGLTTAAGILRMLQVCW